jgi:CRP/FNR family transcriptional regulator, transcriptional activator FtrB
MSYCCIAIGLHKGLKIMANQSSWLGVRTLPFFRDLDEMSAKTLLSSARVRRFPKSASLIREGQTPDFLHIVVDGLVGLIGAHDGEETTMEIKGRGAHLFLAAVIRNAVYLNSARTITPSQILLIPGQTVRDLCERNAAIARVVIIELAERCRFSIRALKNMKLRSSSERLANWILRACAVDGKDGCIELPFDKRTLASCLGMSPENLSRNLALLAKYGVRSFGHSIVIEDSSALAEFAKPNALIDDWKPADGAKATRTFDISRYDFART